MARMTQLQRGYQMALRDIAVKMAEGGANAVAKWIDDNAFTETRREIEAGILRECPTCSVTTPGANCFACGREA